MRSIHLAQLAGISVRTLRHYHQVGVLAEPIRSSNGYRDYDTHDLVRVLRIRRLADLGFSLAQVSTILWDDNPAPNDLLDTLDTELARQIERLTRQRELLAHLKRHDAPPDLLPEIAASHNRLKQSGLPESAAKMDRDHALLLGLVVGQHGQGYVAELYEILSAPDRVHATAAAMTAWASLDDESTDEDVDQVAHQLRKIFTPIFDELALNSAPGPPELDMHLIQEHATRYITDAQARLLEKLQETP